MNHPLSDNWLFPEELAEMFDDDDDENCYPTSSDDTEAVRKEAARRAMLQRKVAKR